MKVILKNTSLVFQTKKEPTVVYFDNYVKGYYDGTIGSNITKKPVSSGYYCMDNLIKINSMGVPVVLRIQSDFSPSTFGYNFWFLDSEGNLLIDPPAFSTNDTAQAKTKEGYTLSVPEDAKYIGVHWRSSGEPFAKSWLTGDIQLVE